MSVIRKLASSLHRRDEVPNQELASEIVLSIDKNAVKELIENLTNIKAIQNDCIKVLYEIGDREPKLIANYVSEFVKHLDSKNNRLQWGSMIALGTITKERPKEIYNVLPTILKTADEGSVITKDNAVNILIKLCDLENYSESTFTLLVEQISKCPSNQVPMYAERALSVVNVKNKLIFVKTLTSRLDDFEKETQRKRVEKVLKKVGQIREPSIE